MGDRVRPSDGDEVLREPVARVGTTEQHELSVEEIGDARDRGLESVHHEADVTTIEIPAVQHVAGLAQSATSRRVAASSSSSSP